MRIIYEFICRATTSSTFLLLFFLNRKMICQYIFLALKALQVCKAKCGAVGAEEAADHCRMYVSLSPPPLLISRPLNCNAQVIPSSILSETTVDW